MALGLSLAPSATPSATPSAASLPALAQSVQAPQVRQPLAKKREQEFHKSWREDAFESAESDEAGGEVATASFGRLVALHSRQGQSHTGSGQAGHDAPLPGSPGRGQEPRQVGTDPLASPAFTFQPREEVGSLLKHRLAVSHTGDGPATPPRNSLKDLTGRVLKATANARLALTHSRLLKFPLAIYA